MTCYSPDGTGEYMASQTSFKPQFYVDALRVAEADIAYPLIRSISPEVTSGQWLAYVKRRAGEGGFRCLFDVGGTLVGLFSYRLGERLRLGRVLAIDDFATFELSRAAPGRAALMANAENLARSLGCAGLEVRVGSRGFADPDSSRATGWLSLGLELESVVLVKPL